MHIYAILDAYLQDGLLAAETGARVVAHEAIGADRLAVLYVEGGLGDGLLAVLAGEMLRMPGLAQSRNDALLYDLIALVTDRFRVRLREYSDNNTTCT